MKVDIIEAGAALRQREHRHRSLLQLLAQPVEQGGALAFHHQVDGMTLGAVDHHLAHPIELLQHALGLLRFLGCSEFPHPQGDAIPAEITLERLGSALGDHAAAIEDGQAVRQGVDFF